MNRLIPILLYHSVSVNPESHTRTWTVSPSLFAAHMAYLSEHRYSPMTVTQFVRNMTNPGSAFPERPVLITFDDGLSDFLADALPVLQSHDFPATIYIVTGFVGGTSRALYSRGVAEQPMLSWSQIAAIHASGIECGAHSHTHPQLDLMPAGRVRDEIVRSKMELEQRLGCAVESFCYPHGYHSATVKQMVQQAGFSSACAVKHAISAMSDDRFALARIIVTPETDLKRFGKFLRGQGLPVAPTQERAQTKAWRLVRRSVGLVMR